MKKIKYLKIAKYHAEVLSKDPSTKVGAFFLDPQDYTIISSGYNGQPRGFFDLDPTRFVRPLKYHYFEHAERNAVYNIARTVFREKSGGESYPFPVTGPLDSELARSLVGLGVKQIYWDNSNHAELSEEVRLILSEGGIQESPQPWFFSKAGTYQRILDWACAQLQEPISYEISRQFFAIKKNFGLNDALSIACAIASQRTKGALAVVSEFPCAMCAKTLISCAVSEVISYVPSENFLERWSAEIEKSKKLFEEFDVKFSLEARDA